MISDIVMPGIDGLTFIKYMKEKYPDMQFIILTGHRNFDYAKDAVNLGAAYFMLKPVNYQELKQAHKALADKIADTHEDRRLEIQTEQTLSGLLSGFLHMEELHKKHLRSSRLSNWLLHTAWYQIITVTFDDTCEAQNRTVRLENLLVYCRHFLEEYSCLFCKMNHSNLAVLFRHQTQPASVFEQKELFFRMQEEITQFFHASVSMGISSLLNEPEQIHEGYIQSLRALGQKFFSGRSSMNFFLNQEPETMEGIIDYNLTSLSARKTVDLIRRSDGILLEQLANDLFLELFRPYRQNIDLIKSSFIIVAVLCIKKIVRDDSRQLAVMLEKYGNFQLAVHADTLQNLKDIFIQENYQSNISLNDIARTVYLSPSYLSSMITSETGKSFTDILNEVRIQKAVELLRDPGLRITDIAYAVGFKEPQYFSIVFKKLTQLTPRDYREVHLNGAS